MTTLVRQTTPVAGNPVLIEEIFGLDSWEVCERLAALPHLLFFDSAGCGPPLGKFSFLAADPFAWYWSRGQAVWEKGTGLLPGPDPFEVVRQRLAAFPQDTIPGLPPFQGGAAGIFGYDLCHHLERLPRPRIDDFLIPDLAVGFYDWVIGFDHEVNRAWIISTGFPESTLRRRRVRARQRLEEIRGRLARTHTPSFKVDSTPLAISAPHYPAGGLRNLFSTFNREKYLATVRRAIEYIHAGDCFQINVAQRLLAPLKRAPLEIYDRLRVRNPAPFAGYFDLGEFVVASASPERFLQVHRGEVVTRPIKGTRPRGSTPAQDQANAEELRQSAKDRAENVMIVDLLRNDLGRVCEYGSVQVESVCKLESYRFVHHLVSEVRGRLRQGLGPIDVLRAAFPGGSVTGAPKIRAMEIIAELEPAARGPYCGSLGYLGFDGALDTNLLIRTLTLGKGWIQFPVGGGIVADSDPQREYEETWHKAKGLLQALDSP